jgi:hypothetical protein
MATPRSKTRKDVTKDGSPVEYVKQPHGGELSVGNPKGPGKPPGDQKYYKIRCEAMAIRAVVEDGSVDKILTQPNHPHFARVLDYVTDRGMGKVVQPVEERIVYPPAVALPEKDPVE